MVNKSTTARVSRRNGDLTVQSHETDSPILPVAQLERLHSFHPEAVEWVIRQTQVEAEYRRVQDARMNTYLFYERAAGQVFAFLIGMGGIGAGAYVAVNGQPWAGATISSLAISGLAMVFLTGRRRK